MSTPRQPLLSISRDTSPDGSTQRALVPMMPPMEVATYLAGPASAADIEETHSAPALSGVDMTDAGAVYVWKRDPTYNAILVPVVGHATAPADLWGEALIYGVREWDDGATRKYRRQFLGHIGFQGCASTFSPTASDRYPGFPASAAVPAVWCFCDVGTVVDEGIPSPGVRILHSLAAGGGGIGFVLDTWGCPWIEVYPSGSVPSGEVGSAASAVKFYITEV